MKLPTSIRYAVRILFELHEARTPLSITLLSEKTGIAFRAIENLHAVLRRHGITSGVVGAKGGLTLSVPLADVTLGRLVTILDNGVDLTLCDDERARACPNRDACAIRDTWRAVSARLQEALDAVSLESIPWRYLDAATAGRAFLSDKGDPS